MKVKFGGKFFQTKLLSARLSHKVCRLLSSPVLLRKFTNTVTLKYSAYFAFYTRSVFYIYPVRNPQPAVPIFMPPDLKRFTLRSILQQGYNKSLITSEKNIQFISWKTSQPWYMQALDCCWRNISVRDSSTKTRNTPSLQGDRHLVCSRATPGFTLSFPHISPTYSAKRLEESDMLFHNFG